MFCNANRVSRFEEQNSKLISSKPLAKIYNIHGFLFTWSSLEHFKAIKVFKLRANIGRSAVTNELIYNLTTVQGIKLIISNVLLWSQAPEGTFEIQPTFISDFNFILITHNFC